MSDPELDAMLAQLWAGFAGLARDRVAELTAYAAALTEGRATPAQRLSAHAAAHKLAGVLGTYGRSGSPEAGRLEVLLAAAAPDPSPPEVVALVRAVQDAVEE